MIQGLLMKKFRGSRPAITGEAHSRQNIESKIVPPLNIVPPTKLKPEIVPPPNKRTPFRHGVFLAIVPPLIRAYPLKNFIGGTNFRGYYY